MESSKESVILAEAYNRQRQEIDVLEAQNADFKAALEKISGIHNVHNNGSAEVGYMVICGVMRDIAKQALKDTTTLFSVTTEITAKGYKTMLNFGGKIVAEEWKFDGVVISRVSGAFEHESIPDDIFHSLTMFSTQFSNIQIANLLREWDDVP